MEDCERVSSIVGVCQPISSLCSAHRRKRGDKRGGALTMASAKCEPITGVLGQSPQLGPGAEPLVWGSGGEAP